MKNFFFNLIGWLFDHPIINAVIMLIIYYLIVGKYMNKPASEVPAWVFM